MAGGGERKRRVRVKLERGMEIGAECEEEERWGGLDGVHLLSDVLG